MHQVRKELIILVKHYSLARVNMAVAETIIIIYDPHRRDQIQEPSFLLKESLNIKWFVSIQNKRWIGDENKVKGYE